MSGATDIEILQLEVKRLQLIIEHQNTGIADLVIAHQISKAESYQVGFDAGYSKAIDFIAGD